jgi:glycosyltransferase 2 family protein
MRRCTARFSRRVRRRILLGIQVAFAAAVIWYAAGTIAGQWQRTREAGFGFEPRWWLIAASGLIVLGTYALLIQTWRVMVSSWGSSISWHEAARIWFVSNLGKYVPGKVWQILAMGAMAQRAGVSPVAAGGSAIVINVVNLLAGVGVVGLTGASLLGRPAVIVGTTLVLAVGVLLAPTILPVAIRLAERVLGRSFPMPPLPRRPIWIAGLASILAWILYGIAFWLLAMGVAPTTMGALQSYIAAFTASYILGYVMLFAPGGLGVRDISLAAFLDQLHLTSGGAGILVAVASRLWLTVLEILPGAIYYAIGAKNLRANLRD